MDEGTTTTRQEFVLPGRPGYVPGPSIGVPIATTTTLSVRSIPGGDGWTDSINLNPDEPCYVWLAISGFGEDADEQKLEVCARLIAAVTTLQERIRTRVAERIAAGTEAEA